MASCFTGSDRNNYNPQWNIPTRQLHGYFFAHRFLLNNNLHELIATIAGGVNSIHSGEVRTSLLFFLKPTHSGQNGALAAALSSSGEDLDEPLHAWRAHSVNKEASSISFIYIYIYRTRAIRHLLWM